MSSEKIWLSLGINLRGIYLKKKKNALNNKIDNAFKSSCSKIFLWQNRIYLPGSGTWLASAVTEKGELFAKVEASGLGHSSDSHLDVPSYRKLFPPPRTKPSWRETILKVFYHLIALMIYYQLNTILSFTKSHLQRANFMEVCKASFGITQFSTEELMRGNKISIPQSEYTGRSAP